MLKEVSEYGSLHHLTGMSLQNYVIPQKIVEMTDPDCTVAVTVILERKFCECSSKTLEQQQEVFSLAKKFLRRTIRKIWAQLPQAEVMFLTYTAVKSKLPARPGQFSTKKYAKEFQ